MVSMKNHVAGAVKDKLRKELEGRTGGTDSEDDQKDGDEEEDASGPGDEEDAPGEEEDALGEMEDAGEE